jgi:hypothetical protein
MDHLVILEPGLNLKEEDRADPRKCFIREYLLVPKGFGADDSVSLRDFQSQLPFGPTASMPIPGQRA